MKKVLLVVFAMCLFAGASNAQDYKPFKLGIGLGFAKPGDGGGGILFAIEPAYRLNDDIALGLKWEAAAMAKVVGEEEGSVSGNSSYTLNGQYYLTDTKARPYVGVGLGFYSLASVSVNTSGSSATGGEVSGGSEFGFYPRIGLDVGHFNINIDYNIISATTVDSFDMNGDPTTYDVKNSYIGIRIGAYFFGGKR